MGFTPTQDLDCQRPGIVPPYLTRNAGEELECRLHSFQDGFAALARQRHQERTIAVRPHATEHVGRAPSVGIIDLHLAEVELHPTPGQVIDPHERLAVGLAKRRDVPPDRIVASAVVMFDAQSFVDTAAILASFTSTCRRHEIDPQRYLTQLLTNLPDTPVSQLDQWLPDEWKQQNDQPPPSVQTNTRIVFSRSNRLICSFVHDAHFPAVSCFSPPRPLKVPTGISSCPAR